MFSLLVAVSFAASTLAAHAACICASGLTCSSGVNDTAPGCSCCGSESHDKAASGEEATHGSCCSATAPPAHEKRQSSCCASHKEAASEAGFATVGAQPCSCALSSDSGVPAFPGREQPQLQPGKRLTDDLPVVAIVTPHNPPTWREASVAYFGADRSPPSAVPTAALLCTFRC